MAGLIAAGHEAIRYDHPQWPASDEADALFAWCGVKGDDLENVKLWRTFGKPGFVMERGFFDRFQYTQIDREGFNHRASWRHCFEHQPPAGAADRLLKVAGECRRVQARRDGYVLVLGQVAHDSQLKDSWLQHVNELASLVIDATPDGVPVAVRPHPRVPDGWTQNNGRAMLAEGTLAEALAGARFVVTINSNAGNDALIAGVPVLAYGPALYCMAGAALGVEVLELRGRIAMMLQGFRPDPGTVARYLQWLACRQWSAADLADGKVLADLIEGRL